MRWWQLLLSGLSVLGAWQLLQTSKKASMISKVACSIQSGLLDSKRPLLYTLSLPMQSEPVPVISLVHVALVLSW